MPAKSLYKHCAPTASLFICAALISLWLSGCSVTEVGDCGGGSVQGCASPVYTVGGKIMGSSGLLTLQLNAEDELTIHGDGDFKFTAYLPDLSSYAVTVALQPAGQACLVSNGTGTINKADVTDVLVQCADTESTGQAVSVVFTTLYNGANSGVAVYRDPSNLSDLPDVLRIESQPGLDMFWAWHTTDGGGQGPDAVPDPMPVVDFTTEIIVLVTDFIYPTGGYSIEVQSVEYAGGAITLNILRKTPAPGVGVTAAFSQPYAVIKFDIPAQNFEIISNVTTTIIGQL